MSQEKKSQEIEKKEHGLKIDTFFQKLPDDYLIKLYKYKGLKKEFLKDYLNECPENEFIRDVFGHGRFAMLCYKLDSSGKQVFFDSVEVNLADLNSLKPIQQHQQSEYKEDTEEKFLQKLAIYKEIFANSSNNSNSGSAGIDGLIQMMTLQIQAQQQSAQFQQQQMRDLVDMQIKNMNQIQDTLLSQKKEEKKGFGELMEAIDFYENIKGNQSNSEDESLIKSFIKNPSGIVDIVNMFSPDKKENNSNGKSEKISDILGKDFVAKITPENKKQMAQQLFEANKNQITLLSATNIIDQALSEKGL